MALESAQMLATVLRRHGATDEQMPLTKSGTPYKAAHPHHPCTIWAGDSDNNFLWLVNHAIAICQQYTKRFGKIHGCQKPIHHMSHMMPRCFGEDMTPFAQAMPEEYRDDDAVKAYQAYYKSKVFKNGSKPSWAKNVAPPTWW